MSTRIFFHQLALERCKHNLAQLCAVNHLVQNQNHDICDEYYETMQSLIESMNRDLSLMHEHLRKPDAIVLDEVGEN